MKYKMIEIGIGWVLERLDEDGDFEYYDSGDGNWWSCIYDNSFQPKEVIQQKYDELVLEEQATHVNSQNIESALAEVQQELTTKEYRQKVEDHYNNGGEIEWICVNEDRVEAEDDCWDNFMLEPKDHDFNWDTFNYRIKDEDSKTVDDCAMKFTGNGECFSFNTTKPSQSRQDMIFQETINIVDRASTNPEIVAWDEAVDLATERVDYLIEKVGE